MATELTRITRGMPGEAVEHLQRHHVITLSSSSFTGMPHADTAIYMNDSYSIFFFAGEETEMLRNIKDSGRVSFTVDDYTVDWRKVRELQGVGSCQPTTEEQNAAAWPLYLSKFGQGSVQPPGILHAIAPSEVHFVDYNYAAVPGQASQIRRTYQLDDVPLSPSQDAVATSLDRLAYEPGQIVFRPGDSPGEYYVVIDGEVEIQGPSKVADHVVMRVRSGR
jgi:uncharacterized protein YhbP (UPF0306 family)